ncbi:TPA: hypothetical protein QEM98_000428 [Stenotrophomonas maltophilia]|nr:hypothetical protein [Stenotrophomonas maltophilia]
MAKKKPTKGPTWNERLDAAVSKRWPDVVCETTYSILAMSWVSRWRRAGTEDEKLKPALARQVGAFVAGFMASEEAHHG